MTDSLFNAQDNTGDDTPPAADPNKNWLEELVGEGKKFKDPNELARGKAEADAFIERLKREQEELRTELNTRLTLEQYLDKMGSNANQNQNGRSDPPPNEPNGDGSNTTALKPEDIERLIETKVSEREKQRIQSQNRAEVKQKLTEAFGNDYISKLKEVGGALGLSAERLDEMAAESPKAFLKLVGADTAPQNQQRKPDSLFVPPTGQTTQTRTVSGDRTKSYYDTLKKNDPKNYWSAAVQNQMHKDALRLGENFFDS